MPKLNSGLDRAHSAHNVSKKRSKVERELSSLVDAEDRLQLQKDMQCLAAEVKASPHKMRPSSERNRFLHPDLQGKCQNRLPRTFLKYDLGLRLPGFTKPIIDALSKRDSQVMRKIHAKVSLTSDHHPIGTLCRRTWLEAREERIKIAGLVGEVRWNISFDIDWMKVGHFTLLPPMPSDAEPATWVYDTIEFLGMTVPVAGDHKVRGTYIIEQNWDHLLAHIADPMQPWIKVPVWTFFTKPVVEEKIFSLLGSTPLALEYESVEPKSIANDSANSSSSSACGGDPVVQTTTEAPSTDTPVEDGTASASSRSSSLACGTSSKKPNKLVPLLGVRKPPSTPRKQRSSVSLGEDEQPLEKDKTAS